jgi:hypothetical protein
LRAERLRESLESRLVSRSHKKGIVLYFGENERPRLRLYPLDLAVFIGMIEGSPVLDFYVLAVEHRKPSELSRLGLDPPILRIEPGSEEPDNPLTLGIRRRIASKQDPASLTLFRGSHPSHKETDLSLEEVTDLIEYLEIVSSALILLFISRGPA